MPNPTVSRPSTPPLSTPVQPAAHPNVGPSGPGGTSTPAGNKALARFDGAPALPSRRTSLNGSEATSASSAASASNTVNTTRRRSSAAALAKAQTDRAAAQMAEQIQKLAMKEIGSLEPAAVRTYFENNVPRLFGAQAPAQERLLQLFAQAGIPDGERIVTEAMQAADRTMMAALGSGEDPSIALQRPPGPADGAALQRLFDAIDQVRAGSVSTPEEPRIEVLSSDSSVRSTETPEAPSSAGGADDNASIQAHFPPEEVKTAVDRLTEAIKEMPDFLARVMNNRDFDSKTAQWLATTGNVFLRNLASVGVTTFGREFLAYGIELALERHGVSEPVRRGISALAGPGYPTLTHLIGAYRDVMDGGATKEQLRDALIGRGISVATGLGAFFAEEAFGLSHTTTATHVAMTAYTHARDVGVQSWLRLPAAQDPPEDKTHFMFMSVFYGLDQMIVPMLMLMLAPNSGARAARAGLGMADVAKAAAIRAALNTGGEMAEDLANEGNRAIRAGHAPEVGLQVEFRQRHFVNALLGQQSVRSDIISEAQSFVPLIASKMTDSGKSSEQILMVTALMIGLINGVQYWPFAKGFSAQPKVTPRSPDIEEGHPLDDLASSSSSASPVTETAAATPLAPSTDSLEIEELDLDDPRTAELSATHATPEIEEPDSSSLLRNAI